MAKKGFLYAVAGILNEADGTYSDGMYLGPTATFNINPTANDVKDYGDNSAVETDTSVTGGTTSIEVNEMANKIYSFLLGHTYDEEKNNIICNRDDIAPFIGLGAVGVSRANKKDYYTAKFYKKVQCKEPNDENATQQDTLSFTHTTVEGNLFVPEDGIWKEQQTFPTQSAAKEWLNEKVGIAAASGGQSGTDPGQGA